MRHAFHSNTDVQRCCCRIIADKSWKYLTGSFGLLLVSMHCALMPAELKAMDFQHKPSPSVCHACSAELLPYQGKEKDYTFRHLTRSI